MTFRSSLMLVILSLMFTSNIAAQESATAAERADRLRLQLIEVQVKEESLRLRLDQIEEDLKPENIERVFAGIGSTRPEELREHRHRQLTIEKDSIQAQLKILETSRVRLESAIAIAEIEAYHASAQPTPSTPNQVLIGDMPGRSTSLVATGLLTVLTIGGALLGIVVVFPMISSIKAA
jgi:transcriptional antiterminator Rof (Rho-off)